MPTFTRNRLLPLGLSVTRSTASLIQLSGTAEHLELRTAAQCRMPVQENADSETADRAVMDALRMLIADHRLRGRHVVSCLGVDDLIIETVRLPQLPPDEIAKVVQWEASERLPIPVAEAEIRHLIAGEIRQDNVVKQEVILVACPRDVIHRRLKILEGAGLKPVGLDIEPCAWLRSLYRAQGSQDTARMAYLICNESGSTVMFAEGRRILFLKSLPVGGHQFDQAVSQTLGIDVPVASQMRSEVFGSRMLDGENEVHRSIIDSLRPCFEMIIEEMELCQRYHKVTFRGRQLEGLVMSGSESATWLAEYFGERIGLRSSIVTPLDGISGGAMSPLVQQRSGRWATPIGLAMKRLT